MGERDQLLEELLKLRDEAVRILREAKTGNSGNSQELGRLIRDQVSVSFLTKMYISVSN